MRDIEFRGKEVDTGEWVFGFYAIDGDGWYIINDRDDDRVCRGQWFKVHPDTVGQYTGLKDKKGVKIFEGDIIKNLEGEKYVVAYGDHFGAFCINDITYAEAVYKWGDLFEVIGNIHDNRELLEGAR